MRDIGKRIDEQGAELNRRMDSRDKDLQYLKVAVGQQQATLDVLTYGRDLPPPVARARAEAEEMTGLD